MRIMNISQIQQRVKIVCFTFFILKDYSEFIFKINIKNIYLQNQKNQDG